MECSKKTINMKDGKATKIAYADPHYADSALKSLNRFGPELTSRATGRTEKKGEKEHCLVK